MVVENIAIPSQGAYVKAVTSEHPAYPQSNMIDGCLDAINDRTSSFWISTGMYPQEFVLVLPTEAVVKKVILASRKVGFVKIFTLSEDGFVLMAEQTIEESDSIQVKFIRSKIGGVNGTIRTSEN